MKAKQQKPQRKDRKTMSENGKLTAKQPQNKNVSAGQIDFNGIMQGADRIRKEQNEKFRAEMQKKAEQERKRAEEIERLLKKSYEQKQEERKKLMEQEQKREEEKTREQIREKYRAEHPEKWNENKQDKALKQLLADLKGEQGTV